MTHFIAVWLSWLILAPAPADSVAVETDPELRQLLIDAVGDASSFDDKYEAEVWLVDMSARLQKKSPVAEKRLALLQRIHFEASRVELAPELVLAVIDIESNFDRFAISYAGALGLMQVMPFWLDEIGRPDDNLFDVTTNLRMGCTILRYYVDREKGDLARGLARYNGSLGRRIYSDKVLDRLRTRWYQR